MRAKFIYEAFSEKGDPIKDLGIGLYWETLRPGVILKILNSYPKIGKVKGDIIKITTIENHDSGRKIINYVYLNNKNKGRHSTVSWQFDKSWFKENFEILGIDTSVNEKFSEKGDPIKDMGIGKINIFKDVQEIIKHDQIYGSFTLSEKTNKKIHKYLNQFIGKRIIGDFFVGWFETEQKNISIIPDAGLSLHGGSAVIFKVKNVDFKIMADKTYIIQDV